MSTSDNCSTTNCGGNLCQPVNERKFTFFALLELVVMAAGMSVATAADPTKHPVASTSAQLENLEANFRNPPNEYRLVQYGLKDPLLEKFPRYGIGGFMAFFYEELYQSGTNGPKQIGPLVDAAQKKGMKVWLADDFGYPSGMAGGRVVQENPAYEVRGLALIAKSGTNIGPVAIELPAGAERFVSAVLYPLVDGRPELTHGQTVPIGSQSIEASGIKGPWRLCAFATVIRNIDTQAQSTPEFGGTGHYPDLLNSNAIAQFIADMHAPIAARITDLPAKVEGFYANEPNLMQLYFKPGNESRFACMPWNDELPKKFKEMHGYDLMPRLATLFEGDDTEARRVRMHFQQTVGELLSVNFARQIREWCNVRGVHSSGHFLLTEYLSMQVANYGDYLKVFSELDVPAMEIGIPNLDQFGTFRDQLAQFVTAVAVWKKRDTTLCLLDPIIQGGGLRRLSPATPLVRHAANIALLDGVNTFSSYLPLDAYSDGRASGYTTNDYRDLSEYIGRVCVLLRGARPATSVALYYPVAMFQADYRPSNKFWPEVLPTYEKRQTAMDNTENALRTAGITFTLVHPEAVAESDVAKGAMKIGSGSFRYLIMPQMEFLPLAVLKKIKAFEASGGTVLWVDTKPQHGEYARDDASVVAALKKANVIHPADLAAQIPNPYPANFNLRFASGSERLAVARFQRGDQPLYLLVNQTKQSIKASASSAVSAKVKAFDPTTGKITEKVLPDDLEIGGFGSLLLLPEQFPSEK